MKKLLEILEFAADRTGQLSREQSVTGDPIIIGDVTVVPVSKISCGFAGGGTDLVSSRKSDAMASGAGARISKTPLSFLAIRGQDVQMLHVAPETVEKAGLIESLTPLLSQLFNNRKTNAAK